MTAGPAVNGLHEDAGGASRQYRVEGERSSCLHPLLQVSGFESSEMFASKRLFGAPHNQTWLN
jgi:hypothetical protein